MREVAKPCPFMLQPANVRRLDVAYSLALRLACAPAVSCHQTSPHQATARTQLWYHTTACRKRKQRVRI